MVQTLPMDYPGEPINSPYTCSICKKPGTVALSADPRMFRPSITEHASCRNLVGYMKSVRSYEADGFTQHAEETRAIIRDLWAESTAPDVSEFQRNLAARFLANEDIEV